MSPRPRWAHPLIIFVISACQRDLHPGCAESLQWPGGNRSHWEAGKRRAGPRSVELMELMLSPGASLNPPEAPSNQAPALNGGWGAGVGGTTRWAEILSPDVAHLVQTWLFYFLDNFNLTHDYVGLPW